MNSVTRLIFILNEHARHGRKALGSIKRYCADSNLAYRLYLTEHPGHASELVQKVSASLQENERLIVVGGDGTLSEVINGLEICHSDIPIGYIPTGSGNDFARSHKWLSSIEATIESIVHFQSSKQLDIIEIKHKQDFSYAVNSFGVGIDGMVNYQLSNSKLKKFLGHTAYFSSILTAFFKQKSFSVTVESEQFRRHYPDLLLIVCVNHKYFGGGIPIHPEADPTDGLLNLVLAEKVNFFELLSLLFKVLTKQNHLSHKKMHTFHFSAIQLTFHDHQYGQRDGEWLDVQSDYTVRTKKRAFWI